MTLSGREKHQKDFSPKGSLLGRDLYQRGKKGGFVNHRHSRNVFVHSPQRNPLSLSGQLLSLPLRRRKHPSFVTPGSNRRKILAFLGAALPFATFPTMRKTANLSRRETFFVGGDKLAFSHKTRSPSYLKVKTRSGQGEGHVGLGGEEIRTGERGYYNTGKVGSLL